MQFFCVSPSPMELESKEDGYWGSDYTLVSRVEATEVTGNFWGKKDAKLGLESFVENVSEVQNRKYY